MLNNDQIAALFKVSKRTVSYWRKHGFPYYALERLSLMTGDHPEWHGFKICPGQIILPSGDAINKNEIECIPWMRERLFIETARSVELEKRLENLSKLSVSANDNSHFLALEKLL